MITREELKAKGVPDEVINDILATYGADIAKIKKESEDNLNQANILKQANKELQKNINELESKNMTEAEKQQKLEQDLAEKISNYQKLTNTVKAKEILLNGGIPSEELEGIVANIVSESEENTVASANSLVDLFKKTVENTSKKVKEELLNNSPKPPASNGGEGNEELTQEKFDKMTYTEMMKLAETNPEQFNKFNK